ncbi:hypothetical protein V8E53_010316 [Lactarius tabidus]
MPPLAASWEEKQTVKVWSQWRPGRYEKLDETMSCSGGGNYLRRHQQWCAALGASSNNLIIWEVFKEDSKRGRELYYMRGKVAKYLIAPLGKPFDHPLGSWMTLSACVPEAGGIILPSRRPNPQWQTNLQGMHLHSEIPKGGFGIPITNVQMDWFCLQSPSRGAFLDLICSTCRLESRCATSAGRAVDISREVFQETREFPIFDVPIDSVMGPT